MYPQAEETWTFAVSNFSKYIVSLGYGYVFSRPKVLLPALRVKDVRSTGADGSSCHQIEHGRSVS